MGRVNVLVVAEYCDNYVIVITNTDGDFIKNTNVNLIYDKIILGGNPKDYYFGTMEKVSSYGYKTKNSRMSVSYTHLDVYKRQVLGSRAEKSSGIGWVLPQSPD